MLRLKFPRWSFRTTLLLAVGGLTLLLCALTITLLVWQQRRANLDAGRIELSKNRDLITLRLKQLTSAAEMTLDSAINAVGDTPIRTDTLLDAVTRGLPAFEQRPELTFLSVAVSATGEYAWLERSPDGRTRVRLYTGADPGTRHIEDYVRTSDGQFTLENRQPNNGYDPRLRPFYLAALEANGPAWTGIYPFVRRKADDPAWGISYVKPIYSPDRTLRYVWETDFDSNALTAFVQELKTATGCDSYVFETRPGQRPRLVAHPTLTIDGPQPPPAWLAPWINTATTTDQSFISDFALDGAPWLGASSNWTLTGGSRWTVLVGSPLAELESSRLPGFGGVLALGLGFALLAMGTTWWLATRLARPLHQLEQQVAQLEHGGSILPTDLSQLSTYPETGRLARAFERMAGAVRDRERDLRRQNTRLASHLHNTPLGVVEWDQAGRVIALNQAAQSLFATEPSAFLRRELSTLVPPSDRADFLAQLASLQSARHVRLFQAALATNGHTLPCEWYVSAVTDGTGVHVGGCALLLDVSQRLGAERAFLEADERFRTLFAHSPVPILVRRPSDGVLLDLNPAAAVWLGQDPAALRGQARLSSQPPIAPGLAPQRARVSCGISREFPALVSCVAQELDGAPAELWVAMDLRRELENETREQAARARELARLTQSAAELEAEVRKRTAALEAANTELRALDRLKSQFLANMGHELRTPLNSILGFSEIVRQGGAGPVNPEQHRQLNFIHSAGNNLLQLINNLLDVSRLDSGRLELSIQPDIDLGELVRRVAATLAPAAQAKGLALRVELPTESLRIATDPRRCQQVIHLVAQNAVKFTTQGEVYLRLLPDLTALEPGGALLAIRDTGPGISPEQRRLLFAAFRQLDESPARLYEGAGLGLYLVHSLLTQLGGTIEVQSEPGIGTSFTLRFSAQPAVSTPL